MNVRITSYNVCYTKLLRPVPPAMFGRIVHPGRAEALPMAQPRRRRPGGLRGDAAARDRGRAPGDQGDPLRRNNFV